MYRQKTCSSTPTKHFSLNKIFFYGVLVPDLDLSDDRNSRAARTKTILGLWIVLFQRRVDNFFHAHQITM
jgi:hypothetical protein